MKQRVLLGSQVTLFHAMQCLERCQHGKIVAETADIACPGFRERCVSQRSLRIQRLQVLGLPVRERERVFDFSERVEHGFPVPMQELFHDGAGAIDFGSSSAAIPDGREDGGGEIEDPSPKEIRDLRALETGASREANGGELLGDGCRDPMIRGAYAMMQCAQIRALLKTV